MGDRIIGIADDANGNRLREQFAILALADDIAVPGSRAANRRPHLRAENPHYGTPERSRSGVWPIASVAE